MMSDASETYFQIRRLNTVTQVVHIDDTEAQKHAAGSEIDPNPCPATQEKKKLILPCWTQRTPHILIKFNIQHSQFKRTQPVLNEYQAL